MKNLEFNSVLTDGRYPKGFSLPDYLRENGKFSREKTLSEIVREEYGEIDESGLKISVKDVTDEKFDGDYGYFFCNKAKHTALEFLLEKNGKNAAFVADVFVPTKIKSYNFVVHLDFMKYLPTKYCPVEELMDGGIAVAHLYYKEISTDDGDFSSGIAPLFCDRSDKYCAGKLSLWAYAAKIVGEYLINEMYTIKEKLYVAGHSRLGKTALLAAAKYDIFAGCMVNCSGAAARPISRDKHGETNQGDHGRFSFLVYSELQKIRRKRVRNAIRSALFDGVRRAEKSFYRGGKRGRLGEYRRAVFMRGSGERSV